MDVGVAHYRVRLAHRRRPHDASFYVLTSLAAFFSVLFFFIGRHWEYIRGLAVTGLPRFAEIIPCEEFHSFVLQQFYTATIIFVTPLMCHSKKYIYTDYEIFFFFSEMCEEMSNLSASRVTCLMEVDETRPVGNRHGFVEGWYNFINDS